MPPLGAEGGGCGGLPHLAVGGVHFDAADDVVVLLDADQPAVAAGDGVAEVADAVVQHSPPAAELLPRRGNHEPQTTVAVVADGQQRSWHGPADHTERVWVQRQPRCARGCSCGARTAFATAD